MSDQQRVSLKDNLEHVERHFAGSLTVGSKFLPEQKNFIIREADAILADRFSEMRGMGQDAGRVVIQMEFDEPIGTDALVALNNEAVGKPIQVVRDAGTPNETIVNAIQSDTIPQTNIVTIIAGPYGPTGKWGLYTMFPGLEAPPFPNDKQPEDVRQANAEFWDNHGFLGTKAEIAASTVFGANTNHITHSQKTDTQPVPVTIVKNGIKNG